MKSTLGTVTELSHVCSIDAVLSFPVQILFFLSQSSWSNTLDVGVGHRFSLVEWIGLAARLWVREFPDITSIDGELSFSVHSFFSGCQACVANVLDEIIYFMLVTFDLLWSCDLLGTGLRS